MRIESSSHPLSRLELKPNPITTATTSDLNFDAADPVRLTLEHRNEPANRLREVPPLNRLNRMTGEQPLLPREPNRSGATNACHVLSPDSWTGGPLTRL